MPVIRRLNADQKERLLEWRQRKTLLEQRRRRLYNRKYRRGFIYLSSLSIRIAYAILFITALATQDIGSSSVSEEVTSTRRSTVEEQGRGGAYTVSKLVFSTTTRTYVYKNNRKTLPPLEEGDTVIIIKNILGRPIFFTRSDWGIEFPFPNGLSIHLMLCILSIISFFFNDGLDMIGRRVVIGVAFLDLVLAYNYFFI